MKLKLMLTGFAGALALMGCDAGRNQTNVELIQDMMDQVALKAQDYDHLRNEASSRVPPENTVPRGKQPHKYETDPIGAEQNLRNPFGDRARSEEIIARGKAKFDIYCAVCHGSRGHAADDSRLKPYIPLIPSLVTDKVKGYKDGRLYHIITYGQGVMGAYGPQIPDAEDRWAIVSYIRTLK